MFESTLLVTKQYSDGCILFQTCWHLTFLYYNVCKFPLPVQMNTELLLMKTSFARSIVVLQYQHTFLEEKWNGYTNNTGHCDHTLDSHPVKVTPNNCFYLLRVTLLAEALQSRHIQLCILCCLFPYKEL